MGKLLFYLIPAFIMFMEYIILKSLYIREKEHKQYLKMSKNMNILYWSIAFIPVLNIFGIMVIFYLLYNLIIIEDFESDLFYVE